MKKPANIHDIIINNLDSLNDSHQAERPKFFARGLPFYTCIDSEKDLWTKETSDGKMVYVKRLFDFKKKMTIDTPVNEA